MKGTVSPREALFAFLAALAVFSLAASCKARYDIKLYKDAHADVAFSMAVDESAAKDMEAKAAAFSGDSSQKVSLEFDPEAMKKAFAARKDLKLGSIEKTGKTAGKGTFSVLDISAFGKKDAASLGFFTITEANGQKTLAFSLNRENAQNLPSLMVGVSGDFLEILAPPALYGDDLSVDEYKQTLLPFIGKKNMPALEAAIAEIRITPPGAISGSEGGKVEGNVFIAMVPMMSALVLEKPVEFSVSWKNP
jgi:hypothetical protein